MTLAQKTKGGLIALAFVAAVGYAPALSQDAHAASGTTVAVPHSFLVQLSQLLENISDSLADGGSLSGGTQSDPVAALGSDAADLRVGMNALLREHVNLGLTALHDVVDQHESSDAAVDALDENTIELAATVGSVYGNDAEDQFRALWRDHIGFFADYAVGVREDDEAMKEAAVEDLEGYAEDTAAFFSGALNDDTVESTIMAGANKHQELLTASIEAYGAGDYAEAYELQREADKQAQGLADLLTTGIVEQNPDQF